MAQTLSLFIEWKTETEELLKQIEELSGFARQFVDDHSTAKYFHSSWWQSRACKLAAAGHDCMSDTYLTEDNTTSQCSRVRQNAGFRQDPLQKHEGRAIWVDGRSQRQATNGKNPCALRKF
jgi:hypothetical protein